MDRYDLLAAFDHWGVVTPQSKALKTQLEDFHRSGVGRYEGRCLVVTGTDGTGKTWGLRELVANHPECESATSPPRPPSISRGPRDKAPCAPIARPGSNIAPGVPTSPSSRSTATPP